MQKTMREIPHWWLLNKEDTKILSILFLSILITKQPNVPSIIKKSRISKNISIEPWLIYYIVGIQFLYFRDDGFSFWLFYTMERSFGLQKILMTRFFHTYLVYYGLNFGSWLLYESMKASSLYSLLLKKLSETPVSYFLFLSQIN